MAGSESTDPDGPMERARGLGAARPDARVARSTRAAGLGKLPSALGSSETHAGWNDDHQPSTAAAAAPSPRPPPAAGASSALQLAHRSSASHRAALRASGPANAVAFTCRRRRRPDREGITLQVRARRARSGPGAIAETSQPAQQPPSGARRGYPAVAKRQRPTARRRGRARRAREQQRRKRERATSSAALWVAEARPTGTTPSLARDT